MPHFPRAITTCEACSYTLEGLEPFAGLVTCPECGLRQPPLRRAESDLALSWAQALAVIASPLPFLIAAAILLRAYFGTVSVRATVCVAVFPVVVGLLLAVGVSGSIGPVQHLSRWRQLRAAFLAWIAVYLPILCAMLI